MLKLVRSMVSVVARRLRSRAVVELENLAFRHQRTFMPLRYRDSLKAFN